MLQKFRYIRRLRRRLRVLTESTKALEQRILWLEEQLAPYAERNETLIQIQNELLQSIATSEGEPNTQN